MGSCYAENWTAVNEEQSLIPMFLVHVGIMVWVIQDGDEDSVHWSVQQCSSWHFSNVDSLKCPAHIMLCYGDDSISISFIRANVHSNGGFGFKICECTQSELPSLHCHHAGNVTPHAPSTDVFFTACHTLYGTALCHRHSPLCRKLPPATISGWQGDDFVSK